MGEFKVLNLRRKLLCGSAMVTVLAASSVPVSAQVDEIVVTAERRAASVQDVPVSVTAFSTEDLQNFSFENASDVGDQSPNINIVNGNFGFTAPIVTVRGITNSDFSLGSNQPVTTYVDGVPLTNIIGQGFSLFDLERVELLRGPQGTLFGRNSTSGALQFISAMPTDEVEVGAEATYGRFQDKRFTGYASGPLGDSSLLGRVAMQWNERDGNINVINNVSGADERGYQDNFAFRGIVALPETDNFDAHIKLQYGESSGDDVIFHNSNGNNSNNEAGLFATFGLGPTVAATILGENGLTNFPGIVAAGFGTAPTEIGGAAVQYQAVESNLLKPRSDVQALEASLEMNYGLADWVITSLTGFVKIELDALSDQDGSQLTVFHNSSDRSTTQFSEEIRLSGQIGPVDLVAGAFYLNEEGDSLANTEFTHYVNSVAGAVVGNTALAATASAPFAAPGTVTANTRIGSQTTQKTELDSYAVFAHGKIDLLDDLSATLGARWSRDQRDFSTSVIDCGRFTGVGEAAFVRGFGGMTPLAITEPSFIPDGFGGTITAGGLSNFSLGCSGGIVSRQSSASWSAISGVAGLEYHPNDDVMLYGSFKRGFKGGTLDTNGDSALPAPATTAVDPAIETIKEEIVYAYEVGAKTSWFDGRAIVNTSAFFYDYRDFQAFEFGTDPATRLPAIDMLNLPKVEVAGIEVEVAAEPIDNLSATLGVGVVDTKIREAGAAGRAVGINNGNEVRGAADINFNGSLAYAIDIDDGNFIFTPQVDFVYVGSYFSEFSNVAGSDAGDYWQLNLRANLIDDIGRLGVAGFVENVTDEVQVTGRFPSNISSSGTDFATANTNGRTYGIRFNLAL
jgi:iron complex outermembrane recepter protein